MREFERLDAFSDEVEGLEKSLGDVSGMTAAFSQQLGDVRVALSETNRDLANLERGFSSGLKRAFDGRFDAVFRRLADKPIVNRRHRNARIQQRVGINEPVKPLFRTAHPTAAMDDEYQRRRLLGVGFPEVQHVPRMFAVTDAGSRRLGHVRFWLGERR